jgi:hypothetical protein
MTTSEPPRPYWGDILKSNWNGTYFGSSIGNVNRNERGFVDFEKMIGLDGIAIVNVVSNPEAAAVTGTKELQTRITHNDGGSWKPLTPPKQDSHSRPYDCDSVVCVTQACFIGPYGDIQFRLARFMCMDTRSDSTLARRSVALPLLV